LPLAILGQIIVNIASLINQLSGSPAQGAPASMTVSLIISLIALVIAILSIVFLMMMMAALQRPMVSRVLAAIAQFIPLVNLIVLVVVNQRAVKVLRESGYRVGLLGAKPKAT